ncbi:MAG TPA: TRAP transporter small permease subunit [Burkholderiaceae bacterium]|jgi:TRAP-type transport system small permease protein|nr:TRAP transporter small permease subunit [Burkholderiaceae bacterium]
MTDGNAVSGWRRFTAFYHALLSWLLAISVAVLIVPVTLQIFSRFTQLLPHYIWTEEMARLLFVWMIMIGSMIGIREGSHFVVDVWPRLGVRAGAALNLFGALATLVLALVFLWWGIEFTRFGWHRISELAELPLWLIHIAWPLAGLSWVVFLGERMLDDWRRLMRGSR